MRFGPVSIDQAVGKILGHNIAGDDGRRALRKGKPLSARDITVLRGLGRHTIYVAELVPGDVDENQAAGRIADAVRGPHLRLSGQTTGRANLLAETLGLLRVDVTRLVQLNLGEAVTLATLPNHSVVRPGQIAATLKIIAYALPEDQVREAEQIGRCATVDGRSVLAPLLRLDPLPTRSAGLILSGSPSAAARMTPGFTQAVRARLEHWGSRLDQVDFVPLEDPSGEISLSDTLRAQIQQGREIVILAGETAIMDRHDIAPRAVERAGGEVTVFGAPVDPGNLLMLAHLKGRDGDVPIIGAPGCARSPKQNIIDLVIPRLLAGDRLTKMDIVLLGHGGLLEDVVERGRPRDLT